MAQKYIGSLPSLYRNEKWVDRQVRAPKGKVEKNIEIPLEVPKSTVIVLFNREMKYTLKEAYTINILGNILTNRYTKTIREEQGGTYGVGVSGSASREPYNNYNMYMTFECDPEKANELKPLLYKEVDNIIREGVTEEELSKVVKNTLKEAEQSKQHNAYWLTTLVTYYKTGVNLNDPKKHGNPCGFHPTEGRAEIRQEILQGCGCHRPDILTATEINKNGRNARQAFLPFSNYSFPSPGVFQKSPFILQAVGQLPLT